MSPVPHAAGMGVERALIEMRQVFTSAGAFIEAAWFPVAVAAVINGFLFLFQAEGGRQVIDGEVVVLAIRALADALGFLVAWYAIIMIAMQLAMEREDGTLLRLKSVPHGLVAHVSSLLTATAVHVMFVLVLTVVPALFIVDGVLRAFASGWLEVVGWTAFGLVACLPLGILLGSIMRSAKAVEGWLTQVPFFVLLAMSSDWMFPMPEWTVRIAEFFPILWLGLGMRSALLPDAAGALQVTGSWRTTETLLVLGLWTLVGLVVAPIVLRRTARRESGSRMEAERDRLLQESR